MKLINSSTVTFISLTIAAIVFIAICMPFNLSIAPDSVTYIEGARSIAESEGFRDANGKFINHWPPGYSLLLASIKIITDVKILNFGVFLHGFLIIIYGVLFITLLRAINTNQWLSVSLLLILYLSKPTLVFKYYQSEPLFLIFFIASLLAFIKWKKSNKAVLLLISGLFCGIFLFVRYAGVGFIIAYNIYLLLLKVNIKAKLRRLIIFNLPIAVITITWLAYSISTGSESINRNIVFHLISISKIVTGIKTIASWFMTKNLASIMISGLLFSMLSILLFKEFKTSKFKRLDSIVWLILLLILFYVTFLVFSISLIDAQTSLNNRILSPLFPMLLILIAIVLDFLYRDRFQSIIKLFTIVLILHAPLTSYREWRSHFLQGDVYNGEIMLGSKPFDVAKKYQEKIIYTNAPKFLNFQLNIQSFELPNHTVKRDQQPNSKYLSNLKIMENQVLNNDAVIIYFNAVNRWFQISKKELLTRYQNLNIETFDDGIVISKEKLH